MSPVRNLATPAKVGSVNIRPPASTSVTPHSPVGDPDNLRLGQWGGEAEGLSIMEPASGATAPVMMTPHRPAMRAQESRQQGTLCSLNRSLRDAAGCTPAWVLKHTKAKYTPAQKPCAQSCARSGP